MLEELPAIIFSLPFYLTPINQISRNVLCIYDIKFYVKLK